MAFGPIAFQPFFAVSRVSAPRLLATCLVLMAPEPMHYMVVDTFSFVALLCIGSLEALSTCFVLLIKNIAHCFHAPDEAFV
jgi:hypothetical protein